MSSVPTRNEIDEEYKWDLSSLYVDNEDWEGSYENAESLIDEVSDYEGRSTEDAATLLETMERYEDLMRTVSNVASYARMRRDEDTTEDRYQAMAARSQSLSSEASSAASFIEPEIQEAGRDRYERVRSKKREDETFSEAIDRLTSGAWLLDLEGTLTDEEADDVREAIDKSREAA